MGTSSSSSGPKGNTSLLPSWATGNGNSSDQDQGQDSDTNKDSSKDDNSTNGSYQKNNENELKQVYNLKSAKGALTSIVNKRKSANFKNAAKNYVRNTGGYKNATRASASGVITGAAYLNFFSGLAKDGLAQTLRNYDLSDCIGKSTDEVLAKISNKIAPIGSTNDEAISRVAVMIAFDKLCENLIENGKDLNSLDHLDEDTLKNITIEFISAYIFKKWIYEAGLALERNDLSESDAVELENEMRVFISEEVRTSLRKIDILSLDITKGEGRKVIENIFDLAYSTLEK